ncbi:glyoxylate reductase/hydroxypyruvate reductase-like [Eupeodes corollae]|uniref:glyoxylate reductase/hydroxypyruvate reductase-like n=1 Tax=Eupeodes corollae TaxID=290404 RepID=UPI00249226A6|nr:glyoxylate reductase/hydroxypyruvate reductase-like [Eupeodes corollae]XP_055920585.1 glyoxylate reductase/hydroxypyruvate reductase-like [Eupeodes corollae]XP_055920586.1 glyoxylate reductase/hydroxypyruvate reductase-like [Eupeodes corollae]
MSDSSMHNTQKKPRVLITHPELPNVALDLLRSKCELVIVSKFPPEKDEILQKGKGVDAIFWRGRYTAIGREFLDAIGPQLRCISTMSTGFDFVDIEELKRRKILLGTTMRVQDIAVAELTIGLMIAAARRFHEGKSSIENSTWNSHSLRWLLGQEIRGSKIGFFGFGNIAQAIAGRLKFFKVDTFLYHSRNQSDKADLYDAKYRTFDELLEESDFLIIACPLTNETREKFNARAFDKMKSNAVLVNISRGQIIDQKALYNALKTNKIFAAGLDVMNPEPLPSDDPLLSLPNCVIIPHLGATTERTRTEMAIVTAQNILKALAGEPMISPAY